MTTETKICANRGTLFPYMIVRKAGEPKDTFHVRGPGESEVYPWATYEDAEKEAKRLKLGYTFAQACILSRRLMCAR